MKNVDIEMWIHDSSEDEYHTDVDLVQNINVVDEVSIARQVLMFVNFLRAQTYSDETIKQFIDMDAVENGEWD